MSCNLEKYESEQENRGTEKGFRIAEWEKWVSMLVAVSVLFACLLYASHPWAKEPADARTKWEQQTPRNDGAMWKGTPDGSIYADMEGVECTEFFLYSYDRDGRLTQVEDYRRHDYYPDTYMLCGPYSQLYDEQGRIRVETTSNSDQWIYEYSEEGYTKTRSRDGQEDVYTYDLQGNLIASRQAILYRYAHEYTFVYDERDRKVRETTKIGEDPAYISRTMEYDDEAHTSLEKTYNAEGETTCIWVNTYDKEGRKIGSTWCNMEDLPRGWQPEECTDYYTVGYWADYENGLLMEELENKKMNHGNRSVYHAYDYDAWGNCILNITLYGETDLYLTRYEYDDNNRLTEKYCYHYLEPESLELLQADGNTLTIDFGGAAALRITRTAQDGTPVNQFVYSGGDVELQVTQEEAIYWQTSPALLAAEDSEKQPEPERTPAAQKVEKKGFTYTVAPGDCLWSIAEYYLGDGQKYWKIYRTNREIIGDDPGLILPGMALYIEKQGGSE